jgi:type I restriction enzyme, S subunit
MNNDIPDSWIGTTLDDIVIENNNAIKRGPFGSSIRKEFFVPVGYKVYEQKNVIYNDFNLGNYFINEQKFKELKDFELKSGDIVISCSGTIGKIAIAPENLSKGIINQALLKISLNDSTINKKYFLYLFTSDIFKRKITSRGSAMLNLTSVKDLKKIIIPLPPFNEQKRIISKLEELFTKLDAGIEYLKKNQILLKQYRQSILKFAFEGKLTEKWRKENSTETGRDLLESIIISRKKNSLGNRKKRIFKENIPIINEKSYFNLPSTWAITNIDFLAHVTKLAGFEYTKYIKKLHDKGDIPVIRAQNVKGGKFKPFNLKYISKEISDNLERSQIHGREILMTYVGILGDVCLAPEGKWHLAPNVAKIDVDGMDKNYLCYYLQSSIGLSYTLSRKKETVQASISMENIRKILVCVPPLKEQNEIVNKIEYYFSIIDKMEKIFVEMMRQSTNLHNTILKNAFEGKLVPQDPTDEPAEILLEKIKQERESIISVKEKLQITKKKSIDNDSKQMRLM